MNNTENNQDNILLEEQREFDKHKITADQMPKMKEPAVFVVAIICLFKFVILIWSLSINTKCSTPVLASPSATNEPTPPIPNIATFAFFSFSIPFFPINSSVLEN